MPFQFKISPDTKADESRPNVADRMGNSTPAQTVSPQSALFAPYGQGPSPETHASYLSRVSSGSIPNFAPFLLQLQRHYGNHHVQRVIELARLRGSRPTLQRQDQQDGDSGQSIQSDDRSSLSIQEDLFVPDDQNNQANDGSLVASGNGVIQRQKIDDIPPPPPAFPSVYQWASEVSDDALSLYGLTCEDRRERGFVVMWNEQTNKSFSGPTAIGDPPSGCTAAEINIPLPPDRPPIYSVGWFHTHPPANKGCRKVKVGPSQKDLDTSQSSGLPGMVEDTTTTAPGCTPSGLFFFGPTTRK